jgi:hypothetical protein
MKKLLHFFGIHYWQYWNQKLPKRKLKFGRYKRDWLVQRQCNICHKHQLLIKGELKEKTKIWKDI